MKTCSHKGNWAAIASTATVILALAPHAHAVKANGGDITVEDGYVIHTFTNSGTLEVLSGGNVEVLVVAGGGGGGGDIGGGGGAGGLVSDFLISAERHLAHETAKRNCAAPSGLGLFGWSTPQGVALGSYVSPLQGALCHSQSSSPPRQHR